MKKITPLIYADPERSGYGDLLLTGPTTGYTPDQIRAGYTVVTPILNADGELGSLEVQPTATVVDICAVLHNCGIPIQALSGVQELDALNRTQRYFVIPDDNLGSGVYALSLVSQSEFIPLA